MFGEIDTGSRRDLGKGRARFSFFLSFCRQSMLAVLGVGSFSLRYGTVRSGKWWLIVS